MAVDSSAPELEPSPPVVDRAAVPPEVSAWDVPPDASPETPDPELESSLHASNNNVDDNNPILQETGTISGKTRLLCATHATVAGASKANLGTRVVLTQCDRAGA